MSVPWATSLPQWKTSSTMADSTRSPLLSSALWLFYPVVVFVGLRHLDPRWLAVLLVAAATWRLVMIRTGGQAYSFATLPLMLAVVCATFITLVTGSSQGLLLYPVMVNGVLLVIFTASLLRPPTVIEALARLREPDLPPRAVHYTRRVTQLWAVFFASNGAIALITVFLGEHWWALYNGLVAYLLMGTLMGGEWLVRRRLQGGAHG